MTGAIMRVYGYVRVSTENQLENYSIDEQVERLKAYCLAKGWTLAKVYTDGGFSGGNLNRPALTQMLSDLHTAPVDAIVVYKLDRLSRSQKDTLTLIEDEFLANGVDFVSINENFDTSTPFGRAMIGILSVFAQLEKDQITERFTMGRIGRSKAGYYHGGPTPPTGYDYRDGLLIIHEYEALAVKDIFRLFLAGKSVNAICEILAPQYPLMKFSAAKVLHILRNTVYIGRVKFAGKEYPGNHPPIIDEETFWAVQRLLDSAEREEQKTSAQKTPFRAGYLLSSLVYCQRCGARYSANHGYYRCYSRAKSSKRFIKDPNCRNDHWEISALDNYVVSSIRQLTSNHDRLHDLIGDKKAQAEAVDRDKLKARIADLEAQLNNVINLYQVGTIPMELVTQRAQKLDAEKKRLLQELNNATPAEDAIERFLGALDAFEEGFDEADIDMQRMYVSALVSAVYIDGQTVNIQWRI